MFIRQVKKQRNTTSGVFYQYNLVQSARINGKVRQRIVLYLGSDSLLADPGNRNTVLDILKSHIYKQPELFPEDATPELKAIAGLYYQKYLAKYPPGVPVATRHTPSLPPDEKSAAYEPVDVQGVTCSENRTFGCEHLCTQVLQKLGLADYLKKLEWGAKDRKLALIGIASRAIFSTSEYKTAEYLAGNSDLCACLGYEEGVSHKHLYRISDKLYQEKEKIDSYLYERVRHMFNLKDKLVIFDLSNTYFEGGKKGSKLARYGRSKEKRNDCKQVVFTGVINAEGFIRHSRIYEGNKPDTASVEDMLKDLERHSEKGQKKTVVIDAGIATEENLEKIASKGYEYVCVARSKLKDYEASLTKEKVIQLTDRERKQVELKIIPATQQRKDTWMYVKSEAKVLKEKSMEDKLNARFVEDMDQIKRGIEKKGGIKTLAKIWERIGRVKEKYPGIAKQYDINVQTQEPAEKTGKRKLPGKAAGITWSRKANGEQDHGVYFIRTNGENPTEKELWDVYNTIREVEATFRCLKSDLNIRPVHHQNDGRIEAHIYLTILAYQLVNTIRYMLKQKGIHYDWNNIVRIMNTHIIQSIQLPTPTKTIHLRKPANPGPKAISIYQATNTDKIMTPTVKYVVYH